MRLYIIRHADPDYANDTITPAGHLEARALAQRMAREGLTRISCSPLGRAVATMRYTADATGLTPVTEDWTAELSDFRAELPEPWPALAAWDVPGEVIRADLPCPTSDNWHGLPCFARPVIRETFERIRQHSDAFLARHGYVRDAGRYRVERPNRERIAVFCHNGFGLSWLAHLLEIPLPLVWSGFWMAPTAVTTVLFDERSPTWAVPRCLGVGDTSHLHAAQLPIQPAGIKANYD